jgi:four helix bundle protein
MSRSYRDLIAWQKAMDMVAGIYQLTLKFPKEELYVLTSQLRRCAVSVPSNIAEGQGRGSPQEFKHFISIAMGSLTEIETQILIAQRLSYISEAECDEVLQRTNEVGRLLGGLYKAELKPRRGSGRP